MRRIILFAGLVAGFFIGECCRGAWGPFVGCGVVTLPRKVVWTELPPAPPAKMQPMNDGAKNGWWGFTDAPGWYGWYYAGGLSGKYSPFLNVWARWHNGFDWDGPTAKGAYWGKATTPPWEPNLIPERAPEPKPLLGDVDGDAVRRMGNYIRHLDGFTDEPDPFAEEVGQPPKSDVDKWFISVITMRGCPTCAKLKQDWLSNENLRSFARPDDAKTSWAHFNYYDKDDTSQTHRWKNIQITSYPTILVQPPRNGKYTATDVVFQQTYGANPDQLAANISRAIKRYLGGQPKPGFQGPLPFHPKPKVDPPPDPKMPPPVPGPVIPPDIKDDGPPWTTWAIIAAVVYFVFFRKQPQQPAA
jgi:hypothetical protein